MPGPEAQDKRLPLASLSRRPAAASPSLHSDDAPTPSGRLGPGRALLQRAARRALRTAWRWPGRPPTPPPSSYPSPSSLPPRHARNHEQEVWARQRTGTHTKPALLARRLKDSTRMDLYTMARLSQASAACPPAWARSRRPSRARRGPPRRSRASRARTGPPWPGRAASSRRRTSRI